MTFDERPTSGVSAQDLYPLERNIRSLFYDLGIVALNNLLGFEACQLYTDLQIAEPEAPYPIVGMGLVAIAVGDHHAAEQYFKSPIVLGSPLAPYAQGYLAISYKMNGNNGGFEEAALAATNGSNGELQSILDAVGNSNPVFAQN